jgi:type IX secretion system substrate protein
MITKTLSTTLIVILICTSSVSFSQTNSYFVNNPVWKISSSCAVPYPCVQNELYNYYTDGDTIFNTLIYKKIYKKGQGTYNWLAMPPPIGCSGSYNYIDTVPSYFLRSAGKQIFLRQPFDTSEYLLYDFNLLVGDTLPITYNNYETDISVTAIDSIYTLYGYLKRFTLTGSTWAQYLLEGIGHSKGLVEPLNLPFDCGFNLECFSLNDTAYFPAIGQTCNIAVGIASYNNEIPYSIIPNPFTTVTTIQFNSTIHNAVLFIYNLYGQKIKTIADISGDKIKIERGTLRSGLYFYELKQNNKNIATGKLMIVD